jgi:hypothetical protein
MFIKSGRMPFSKAEVIDILYPIGSFYTQYPDAESNDDAVEFPVGSRPQTLFGGTWAEQWANESIFFRTRGTDSDSGRTDGKQADQMQGHWHDAWARSAAGQGGSDRPSWFNDATGANIQMSVNNNFIRSPITDGTNGTPRVGPETRPTNRRIKIWKRVA